MKTFEQLPRETPPRAATTNPAAPNHIDCHRAETARLDVLAGFVVRLAPAIGEGRDQLYPIEPGQLVEAARDDAVVAAFDAVRRLADNSFLFPLPPKVCP
jgi:hypothetical protein